MVELWIPPLRERISDLPILADHLLRRASGSVHRENGASPVLSPEALDLLKRHSWPGNVRELENTLTRAVVLATGSVIRPEHLNIARETGQSRAGTERLPTLHEVEGEHILRVLAAVGGQKARAAEVLGISRPRLDRLLARHALAAAREP